MITHPDWLKKNDKVGLLAPARKISFEEIHSSLDWLENNGFQPVLSSNIFHEDHQFSGNDAERAADLQLFLDDPEIKAILCVRGGYGTVRLIDRLDFSTFVKYPKWICGYSDVTVLHSHIFQNFHIPTIHGVMPFNVGKNWQEDPNCHSLLQALKGENISYTFAHHPLNKTGKIKGKIVGGNLSILYSLLGSSSDIHTKNCILFVEDLDEYLYHIDRMMMSLKRNGKLKNIAALMVGSMIQMNDNSIPFGKTAEEIIAEHCANYDFPLCFNAPAGHGEQKYALRLGMDIHIDINHTHTTIHQFGL